jgi:alpha-methylacyl-CoA racemase
MTMFFGMKSMGMWSDQREANLLDGAAHFYDCYECACGGWLAVGAIEPQFHALLIPGLGLDPADFAAQMDASRWPDYSARIAAAVRTRTRDDWMKVFEGTDACVAPVLSMTEAPQNAFGVLQPAPAPRFSRTPGAIGAPPPEPGAHTRSALSDWGMPSDDIETLIVNGVIAALPGR